MNLSCVVIDDEPLAVSLLESYVVKTPFLTLAGKYNSALAAMAELTNHPVDLLFLDIQMPELNGMEFSKVLPSTTRIIFTTAFEQYAVESYKVNALDYLLKPICYADFLQAANKALAWFQMARKEKTDEPLSSEPALPSRSETIFVRSEYRLVKIALDQVLYIEGLKDYVKIMLVDEPKPILSLMSMKAMEDLLPASRFFRVHRSFIVNLDNIKVIERNRIVFGKTYIPISDNCKQRFFDQLGRRSIVKF